jgi:hypothetical protein
MSAALGVGATLLAGDVVVVAVVFVVEGSEKFGGMDKVWPVSVLGSVESVDVGSVESSVDVGSVESSVDVGSVESGSVEFVGDAPYSVETPPSSVDESVDSGSGVHVDVGVPASVPVT